jgi:hypothetical protein
LLVIISLISSILSTALTSDQIYLAYGKESGNGKTKTKETKTKTKSESKPKSEDKAKSDSKTKDDTGANNDNSKSKDDIKIKDDSSSKETDNKKKNTDDSTTPPSSSTDTTTAPPTSSTDTTPNPLTTATPGNPLINQPPVCDPSTQTCPPTNTPPTSPATTNGNISQNGISASPQPSSSPTINGNTNQSDLSLNPANQTQNATNCKIINGTCISVEKTLLKDHPDGYRKVGEGVCKLHLHCDSSKYNCPPLICYLNKDCPKGFTCSNGYNIHGINGDCRLKVPCDSSKGKCPPGSCNVFKGDGKTAIPCLNNSSNNTSCYPPKTNKDNIKTTGTSTTDTVIKYYITNPIIQKQVTQQPSTSLTQLDTIQFCNLIKDQACVFTNSNFKILFSQTTKDSFGNWVLNGEAQNIASNPINNVRVILHLYDAQGNIIGLTQGLSTSSNLGIGQTTLFNLQENPTSLTGVPKFYRVSFDFLI